MKELQRKDDVIRTLILFEFIRICSILVTKIIYGSSIKIDKCYVQVRALDREITDLQSEFENERTDYLETIRKQERQCKFYHQVLEKVIPTLKKDCNYW